MHEVLYKDTMPPKFCPICLRQNMVMPWKGMNSQICWRGVAELNPNRFIRDLHKQTVTKIFFCGMKCVWLANYLRVFDVSLGKTKANFPNEPIWVKVKQHCLWKAIGASQANKSVPFPLRKGLLMPRYARLAAFEQPFSKSNSAWL